VNTKLLISIWKRDYYNSSEEGQLKDIERILLLIEQLIINISKKSMTPRQDYNELMLEYKNVVNYYNKLLKKRNKIINKRK
tara:strand:- start:174 stop:416 length:243 start_codon:yes stop_codon:yes gene_type:complete